MADRMEKATVAWLASSQTKIDQAIAPEPFSQESPGPEVKLPPPAHPLKQDIPDQNRSEDLKAGSHNYRPATAESAHGWSIQRAFAWLWGTGAIVLALRGLFLFRRLHRSLSGWPLVSSGPMVDLINECRGVLGVRRAVGLRIVPEGFGPAVTGVFRPTILLPESVIRSYTSDQLRYIVLHELAHVRHCDVFMHWLTETVRALHWFNPAVWLMIVRMRVGRELACDEAVLNVAGMEKRHDYGRVVIELVEQLSRSRIAPALVGFFGKHRYLRRRIEHIRQYRPAGWPATFGGGMILATLILVGLTDAAGSNEAEAQPPSQSRASGAEAAQPANGASRPGNSREVQEDRAERFFERIRDGRFDEAAADFSAGLRTVLPPVELEELWNKLTGRFGTRFLGGFGPRRQRFGDESLLVIACEWKNGKLEGRIAFDEAGNIDGLWLVPHDKVPAPEGFPDNGYQFGAIIKRVAQADLSLAAQAIGLDGKPLAKSSMLFWKALPKGTEPTDGDWHDPVTNRTWRQIGGAATGSTMTETHLAPGVYRVTIREGHNQSTPIGFSDPIRLEGTQKSTTVNVRMIDGATLTLRPVEASTGEPIPRPSVTLKRTDGRFPEYFRFYPLRQEGGEELKIPHLPPGAYSLTASRSASHPDDFKYSLVPHQMQVQVEAGQDQELTLLFEASRLSEEEISQRWPWTVTGRVTDAEGKPAADASIVAHAGWGTLRRTGSAVTDENGRYTLRFSAGIWTMSSDWNEEPLNLQCAAIYCHKPGYVERNLNRQGGLHAAMRKPPADNDWNVDPARVIVPGQPYSLDFVLVPAADVEVHLIDAAGEPLADRRIWLKGDNLPPASNVLRSGKTNAQGVAALEAIPPEFAWWFVTRIGETRQEVRSLPITLPRGGRYRVTLRQRRHVATGIELLEIVALTDADGNNLRAEILGDDYRARPPVSEELQARGREILTKMAEVNRYWLRQPPADVDRYRYDFQFTGGEPQTYRVSGDRRVPGVVLRGISYVSILSSLTQDVENVVFRLVDIGPETIRLAYTLRKAASVSCGNGVIGTWKGFFSRGVQEGLLIINARTLTLREHQTQGLREVLSDYVVLREGYYAPLTVQVRQDGHAYHFRFHVYAPGLWLFSESRQPEGGELIAKTTNVFVNGQAARPAE